MSGKTVGTAAKVKEFTSKNGNKYTFQKVLPSAWLDIVDRTQASEGKNRAMYGEVLENIVVQPQMKIDDFEDFAELEEVVKAAIRFQQGK